MSSAMPSSAILSAPSSSAVSSAISPTSSESITQNTESISVAAAENIAQKEIQIKAITQLDSSIVKEALNKCEQCEKVDQVVVAKDKDGNYTDYSGKIKMTEKDGVLKDETGLFEGKDCGCKSSEIPEKGKLTETGLYQEKDIDQKKFSVKAIRVKIKKSCAPKKPEKEHTKTVSKTVTLTQAKTVTVPTTLKETIDHPPETIVKEVTLEPETIINEVTKTLDPETIVKEVTVDYPVTVFKTKTESKTVLSTVIKEPIKSTARKFKTKSSKAITVSTTVILDDDDEEGEDVECEQECSCEQEVCENPCDRIKCVVIEN
ncbi:ribosomal protein L5, partial [Nosema bombycis CQ1]